MAAMGGKQTLAVGDKPGLGLRRSMNLDFHGLEFELPSDWQDVTDDLTGGAPPTLAKPDGVGAMQLSIARYRGGEVPNVDFAGLQGLLEDFCRRHGLDCHPQADRHGNIQVVKTHSVVDSNLVSVWYVSNGMDVVLATYVSEQGGSDETDSELTEAEAIIGSLRF